MILPSANWRRTSCTTTPAVRPTARMASEENRKATEPPMSRPMNVFGSATLICVSDVAEQRAGASACRRSRGSSVPIVSMKRGEQRHRGDDRRADGEALGDGLGGVAHRVEAHHDPLGLAVELAGHLGDAGGVVGHRAEGVLGHDDAGGGQHAHAGEGDQVERELQVAAAEADGDAEGDGDGDDGVDRGLEAGGRCPASTTVAGPVRAASAISCTGAVSVAVKYSVRRLTDLGQDEADDHGAEALPAGVGPWSLPT